MFIHEVEKNKSLLLAFDKLNDKTRNSANEKSWEAAYVKINAVFMS